MAKIVKTLTVSWQWSGDKYSLRGFNLAVTPTAKNPKEEVVATAFVETNEIKQTYSYKMGNVTLDKDAQYKIWVQAVYENSDSDWVSTGGATVTDDGSATIITKTDREIQDIANMASDNILTRQEKVGLRREWQEIVYEFLEIESTAVGQGIPSSNTALSNFKSKGNALGTYLNGGTAWTISSSNKTSFPLWINDSNLGSNTSINGNTYRETFRAYYEAKVKILEEIGTHKIDNVQIGATNIIRNSSNPKTLTHWKSGAGFSVAKSELLGENVFRILTTDATEKYGSTDRYKVEPNCQYTFAMDVYMDANVTSLDVFWLSRAKGSTSDYDSATHFIRTWKDTKSKWVRITGTFTTKATDYEGYIRIDNNGTTNSTTLNGLWFTKVKLEKGNKATDWSPALEDMENAYTIVLTNEAQVIPTNSSRVPTSSTVYHTDVQVYQGTTQRTDYTIGTVNSANGITVSKTASRVSFSVSTETALTVDGGNFTIPITIDGKTFNKTFSWSCSKQGNVGNSGVGISSITEYYAVSSSNTTAPTSWSTTVPTMTSTNKYLWNYEAIKYTNNTTKETAKRVIGAYGDKGATGGTGATGNGISNITNYYLATSSSSGVTTSTSGWTTSVQSVSSSKKYLWNYEVVTYTNGSTNTTTPCIIGTYGDKGDQGDAYTVLLTNENYTFPCANNGNIASAISTTTTVTAYKGATSVTPTIGTLPSVTGLTLSKSGATVTVQANTGTSLAEHGSFNIPVTVDGKSFTKTFSWSKSKQGATGLAKSADIMATGQVFKSSDGGVTYTPSAITLTPSLQNVSFSNWQYSTTGTGSWTTVVSGQNGLTISGNALAISKDSPLFTKTQTSMVFRLNTSDSAIYDTMTIVKLNDMAEVVIGGRNLVSKSYVTKRNSAGSFDDATNTWTLTATAGNTDTWGCGLVISGNKVLVPYGQTYVLSFEIKVPRTCSWNTDVNNYAASGSSWSGNDNDETAKRKTSSKSLVPNQWVKCWILWSNTHSSNTNKVDLYDNTNFGVVMKDDTSDMTFQIRNIKGELGTVPTDWSPAPTDVANDISTAQNAAASAQNTANSAKTEATNATSKLNEIASDSKLTASEKQQVSRDWEEIKLEKPSIINQANVYSISTTAFTNAYTALETYVGTLNLTSTATTTITPSDFKSKFNTYYTQRQAILDEVAKKAKKHADDLVANVNIGGRNLARKGSVVKYGSSSTATTVNDANFTIDGSATISRTAVTNEGAMIDRYVVYDGGVNYVATFKMRTTSGTVNSIHFYNGRGHRNSKVYIDGAYKGTMGQDLTFPNDTNYHKVEVQFEAVATDSATANAQNTQHIIPQPMKSTASAYTVQILNLKIERGNKPTDWSPAPEDTTATIDGLRSDVETMISGVQDQVDGKVETFYQADDPASAWTTTDLKNAHKGDIWYKTTDNMTYRYSGTGWVKLADGDAKSAKDLASSKKRVFTATPTVPYDVGDLWVTALNETGDLKVCKTARTSGSYTASDWVKATDYIDSTQAGNIAQGKVDAQTQATIFNKLTNNGATQGIFLDGGKIWINGEYVKANSITADRLSISDFTNYAQLNNNTATKYGFTKGADETGGAWLKRNSMARDIFISDYYSCNGGESFRIKYDISTTIKGNSTSGGTDSTYRGTAIGLYCYDGAGASVGIVYSTRYSNQTVNGSSSTVKIPTTARKFRVFIQTESYGNWSGELKVRNIQVTKMAGGELIVDGSVTASKIAAKTITADKLHADVLSANSIVSTINGGSTNISGNKIRTGTIQSNNGKSTINLDNGSMNLGATSDASYLQWTGSALNIKANSVSIGTTSVATTKDVTNGINNIDIGGQNLAKQTKLLTDVVLNGWTVTNTGNKGFKKLEIVTNNTSWQECNIPLYTEINTITKSVTISFEYQETSSGLLMFNFGSYNGNTRVSEISNVTVSSSFKVISTNGSWKTVCYTFDPTSVNNKDGITQYKIQFKKASGKTGTIYVRKPKLELGNKATDWSPAPEDVETTVSTIEKRVTSAESKITDTAITNTVKKNFYTKTETENAITSKGYATQSQVQQTADNIQFKFTQSGGYNLVRNGNPKPHNYRNWWVSGNANWYLGRAADIGVQTTDTNEAYAGSATFKVQSGKTYSFNCWLMAESNTKGTDVYFIGSANDDGAYTEVHHLFTSGACGWTQVKKTFTVGSNINYGFIRIDNNGRKDTSTTHNTVVFFSEVLLVQGSEYYPQWSPNPNEVYDGIIEMDKNGIKVSTSNGGWTDFTSVGMNVYNKSSQLSLGTRNGGLTYHSGGQYLGFTSASIVNAYNTRGVSISSANDGAYITLGHSGATDPFGEFSSIPYLSVVKWDFGDSDSFYRQGVNIHTTLNLNTQHINRVGTIHFGSNNASKFYQSTGNHLCMFGNDGVSLGYREGDNNITKFEIVEGSNRDTSDIRSYAHWRFNNWNLTGVGQLEVRNQLEVGGRLKILGTSSIHFNANATYPSTIWHSSNDNKLNIFGDNGVDIGYRVGDNNNIAIKITEGESGAYRIQSFSHWHFNNWNLDYVGNVHAQKFTVAGTSGSYYITKGTGDGADYTTYGCLFYTHNGLAFTANGGAATVIVQGRSGRIMGKNAYYVNSSKCLKSDIRAVTSEREPMPVNLKQGEVVDETLTMEMIGDFIDTIGIRTYITDFEQEGATQKDVDPQQGHVLNLGYIADDLAHHPVFKYIGEKTPDNLYAINSNGLTTVALAGLQAERKERRKLEQRLQKLEAMLLKGEE